MNFQFYFEKLKNSEEFRNFIKENSDAFLCSGFFSIDKQGEDNQQHFDFFIPSEKKILSFQLEDNLKITPLENLDNSIPNRLNENLNFDFEEIEKIIWNKIKKENIKKEIQKILFSLQKLNEKNFIIGTVFISGLGIIKINIDLENKKITDFKKKSFFDMLKILRKR
jgi:hypothetical protein